MSPECVRRVTLKLQNSTKYEPLKSQVISCLCGFDRMDEFNVGALQPGCAWIIKLESYGFFGTGTRLMRSYSLLRA